MARQKALSWKWILLVATGLGAFSTFMAGQLYTGMPGGVISFTAGHVAAMTTLRWRLVEDPSRAYEWTAGFNLTFIQYFDWEMMTYWAIVGLSLALAYYPEAQERTLKASQLETRLVEAQLQPPQR